jgi:hypothetical protein
MLLENFNLLAVCHQHIDYRMVLGSILN